MGRPKIVIIDDSQPEKPVKKALKPIKKLTPQNTPGVADSSGKDTSEVARRDSLDGERNNLIVPEEKTAKKVKAGPKSGRKTKKEEKIKDQKISEQSTDSSSSETKITRKNKIRGKKYQEAKKLVEKNKLYPIDEAVSLVKKTSYSSFDASIDAHFATLEKGLRQSLNLPHGTGKQKKILVLTPKNIDEEVKKIESGKIDFDLLIATSNIMPKLAKVAKILGPKGLMPNPKTGTITDNPEETAKKFEAGLFEIKTEASSPLIHVSFGRTSFSEDQLKENLAALIENIGRSKIKKLTIAATMGPGIQVDYNAK